MFSTRNGQAAPGVKSFGMQGPSKGFSGVRIFKGPTLSSFNTNPFSAVSAHFDSFDVGYRPSQSDISQRLGGPPAARNQQQPLRNWQAPNNNYPSSNPPPQPPSHTYQQNPMPHFGLRTASQSSAPRSQEPLRHRDVQQQSQPSTLHDHNYYIHPGISTDMYIYEASDAFSEYSPSPSPSAFSPALSTDSTMTVQSPSPLPLDQRGLSRDQGRSATPSLRTTTPVPQARSRAQSPQLYPSNSYSSNSNNGGISFPSSLPGIRQAQSALRGFFGSNGPVEQSEDATQTQNTTHSRGRVRTLSNASSTAHALPNSETEFDDLARMNTALNAGYSYYFPESTAPGRPRLASPSGSNGPGQRSPRDSLMFYNGVQHLEQRPDADLNFAYSQTSAATINVQPTFEQAPSSTAEMSGIAAVPALEPSISSSSQSSELSILRTPSPTAHSPSVLQSPSQSYPFTSVQSNPDKQTTAPAAYTTFLSASPEPQLSPSVPVQVQTPAPPLSSSRSHSQSSSSSSSTSNTLNGSDSSMSSLTNRDRVIVHTTPAGETAERNNASTVPDTSPNQAYPMPRVTPTETRSVNNPTVAPVADPLNISQSGRTRNPTITTNVTHGNLRDAVPPATGIGQVRRAEIPEGNGSPVRTRKSSTTSRGPNSSPPRIYGQPATDSQRVNTQAPPRSAFPASNPAPPQQVQTRVRKDSMSLGMKSSSLSRSMSRSNQSTAPSYPSSNIGPANIEPNRERLASSPSTVQTSSSISPVNPLSTSAVPSNIPSSFPEPRRRHSDGDNPALVDATRRSSVPFQSEFVPAVSTAGSHGNRDGPSRDTSGHRPEPTRSRTMDVPVQTRLDMANPRQAAEPLRLRSVRWNEDLICPSPIWPCQRRKGWFNRRGDQLWTNGGAFRSPPQGGEYPPDLDGYPEYGEGWMNEEGTRIDMAHRLIPKAPLRSALKIKT